MKTTEHNRIVASIERRHAQQMALARSQSAWRLLTYLSDDTLQRVADDLDRARDAAAGPLLQLLAETQARRMDRQPRPQN
jgi:hypothetical protein